MYKFKVLVESSFVWNDFDEMGGFTSVDNVKVCGNVKVYNFDIFVNAISTCRSGFHAFAFCSNSREVIRIRTKTNESSSSNDKHNSINMKKVQTA